MECAESVIHRFYNFFKSEEDSFHTRINCEAIMKSCSTAF